MASGFSVSAGMSVSADAAGRPTAMRASGRRMTLTILSIRDERAAYPPSAGPRTVFVVRSGGRHFRLLHLHRERRWQVEELGSHAVLPQAA